MTYNDGTGPQYDRPARRGVNLDAAVIEYEDGREVEYDAEGLPILTEGPETAPIEAQGDGDGANTPAPDTEPTEGAEEPQAGAEGSEGEPADGEPVEGEPAEPDTTEGEPTGEPAADAAEADADVEADEGFDPNDVTVATALAYLAANPGQTEYVLNRERAGKARVTLLNHEEN